MKIDPAFAPEELEYDLLLEALFQRSGYDFRSFERAWVWQRLRRQLRERGLATLSSLQGQVLHEAGVCRSVLRALSVEPAPLFDDPGRDRMLRRVLTQLRSAPLPRIWMPECAGAEAAWAMAILLAEAGLSSPPEIHATIANEDVLGDAIHATVARERMEDYQQAYLKGGGSGSLERYFQVAGKRARLAQELRARITWSQYNLVTDASPNEYDMVACPRALPALGPMLRQRVLKLFHASLPRCGLLGLDRPLRPNDTIAAHYQLWAPESHWYKRID